MKNFSTFPPEQIKATIKSNKLKHKIELKKEELNVLGQPDGHGN